MSNGIFGSVRPAIINIDTDVDVLYHYMPSRGETSEEYAGYKRLEPSNCLVPSIMDDDESNIVGLYSLRLPLDTFNKKGFYTIYIRPKRIKTTIVDVGVLAAYTNTKGIVLSTGSGGISGINDLTGYVIEFEDGTTRVIKSCNRCEPVVINTNDGYPKSTRYNLVDTTSNLLFCTVSPSSAPSFKPNATPYIGGPGVEITISNTKFNPKMIEIEMTEHNADTISYMLEGDQANDRDNSIITTYNSNHEIYHQSDYYVLKDRLGRPLYNLKKKRNNIDHGQDYENIFD